jgi:hypothetical protein
VEGFSKGPVCVDAPEAKTKNPAFGRDFEVEPEGVESYYGMKKPLKLLK